MNFHEGNAARLAPLVATLLALGADAAQGGRLVPLYVGDNFELYSYSKKHYRDAENAFKAAATPDTTVVKKEVKDKKPKSKYDRIRMTKNIDAPLNFDSTFFHLYLIPDLISSDLFNTPYNKYKDEFEAKEKEDEEYDALTYAQQRKFDRQKEKDQLKLGIKELINYLYVRINYLYVRINYLYVRTNYF